MVTSGTVQAQVYSSVHFRKCQTASHGGNCGHTLQLHDQQGEGGRGKEKGVVFLKSRQDSSYADIFNC